jgi:hypothetical protein
MLAKPPERCSPDCELSGTQNYGSEVGARYVPSLTGVPGPGRRFGRSGTRGALGRTQVG